MINYYIIVRYRRTRFIKNIHNRSSDDNNAFVWIRRESNERLIKIFYPRDEISVRLL